MKTLTRNDYYLLSQDEIQTTPRFPPLFKVHLYQDLLKENRLATVYIQIRKEPPSSQFNNNDFYDRCIAEILRTHHTNVYAYENEQIR